MHSTALYRVVLLKIALATNKYKIAKYCTCQESALLFSFSLFSTTPYIERFSSKILLLFFLHIIRWCWYFPSLANLLCRVCLGDLIQPDAHFFSTLISACGVGQDQCQNRNVWNVSLSHTWLVSPQLQHAATCAVYHECLRWSWWSKHQEWEKSLKLFMELKELQGVLSWRWELLVKSRDLKHKRAIVFTLK